MKFPYVEYLGLVEERIFRPLIPITFTLKGHVFGSYALVDSGSDYTILPIEIAGKLGIKLSHQFKYTVSGAGGTSFVIYKSPVKVKYLLSKPKYKNITWVSDVYFAESGEALLLGQKGFFDSVSLKFNPVKKEIEILALK